MTSDHANTGTGRTAAYIVAVIGALLIMACLVLLVKGYTQPPPPNTARVAERLKAAQDVAHAVAEQLDNYGYVDSGKGQVQLPISRAIELSLPLWRNPASARSNLLARLEKFNPPPPKPVSFE